MTKVNNKDVNSGIFINFEHISFLFLVFLLLTLNMYLFAVPALLKRTLPWMLSFSLERSVISQGNSELLPQKE